MDGYKAIGSGAIVIPLYNEPVLLELSGMAEFAEAAREKERRQREEAAKKYQKIAEQYARGDIARYMAHLRH